MPEKKPSSCLSKTDIIGYLNGNLTPADTHRVEAHLLDCELCNAALNGYAAQPNVVNHILTNETYFDAMITEQTPVSTTLSASDGAKISLKTWAWLAAAAMLVALPLGYHFYKNAETAPAIAAEYDNLMPAPQTIVRGENATGATAIEQAFIAYEQADYATSYTQFEKILRNDPQNTVVAFYAGLSAFAKKDWEAAENYLEKVHLAPPNTESSNAVWYLAMIELQKNNPKRAQDFLEELASTPNDWQHKAKTMLAEMEN